MTPLVELADSIKNYQNFVDELYTDYKDLKFAYIKPLLYKLAGMWLERANTPEKLQLAKDNYEALKKEPMVVVERKDDLGEILKDWAAFTKDETNIDCINHLNERPDSDDYALLSFSSCEGADYFIAQHDGKYYLINNKVATCLDAEQRLEKVLENN